MKDLSSRLRDADPLKDEAREGLSADDAQAIRRAMIAAMPEARAVRPIWLRPLPLAAAAALVATISGAVGHGVLSPAIPEQPRGTTAPIAAGDVERRQLQFATPGGTRIIWVFDDNLRLQEPIP